MRKCDVPGCGEKHHAHGYCDKHSKRIKRHGSLSSTKTREYPYCPIWKRKNSAGTYPWLTIIDNKVNYIARVVMEHYLGRKLKSSEIIHHKKGTSNSPLNLELHTRTTHINIDRHKLQKKMMEEGLEPF